jgi:hypothetical protein
MLSNKITAARSLTDAAGVRRYIATLTAGGLLKVGAASIDPFIDTVLGAVPIWDTATSAWLSSYRARALGATSTVGFLLGNATATTDGARVQVSPAFVLEGQGRATDAGGSSVAVQAWCDLLPVTGAAAPTATMQWKFKIGAGALGAAAMSLSSAGLFSTSVINTTGAIVSSAASISCAYAFQSTIGFADGDGLGILSSLRCSAAASTLAIKHINRTDGANNIVAATCYAKGSAITNAATMRLHQFSVVLDAVPTNTEVAAIYCDGAYQSNMARAYGTTTTMAMLLSNTTVAAAGAQQVGPAYCTEGQGWSTDGAGASMACRGYWDILPVTGAAAPTATMQWKFKVGAGALGGAAMTLTSAGILTAGYGISTPYYLNITSGTGTGSGLGNCPQIVTTNASAPLCMLSSARTDGAGNIVAATIYVKGSAITNAATMRLYSFGVTLDAVPTYTELGSFRCNGDLWLNQGVNGEGKNVGCVRELLTIAAGGVTSTTTIQIPAGSIVDAVSIYVQTAIPALATVFSVGIGGATTRFGSGILVAAGTKAILFDASAYTNTYAAATALVITTDANPGANTGRVRVVVHYRQIVAPTS